MTGEFSLDLQGLSATGGERLCDANCVSKFNLLMSGSLSIRLKKNNARNVCSLIEVCPESLRAMLEY